MNESRRNMLKNLMGGAAAISATPLLTSFDISDDKTSSPLKGNINHSVCRWCYNSIPIEELCAAGKKMGLKGIDLVGPKDWPVLKKYGLFSSMCNGAEINLVDGFNDKQFHDTLVKNYSEYIPEMKKAGYKQVICFSGSRRGKDDETGLNNCVEGLKRILPVAEKNNVMVVMELLNSKVDHKDYQCDKSAWGVELVNRVGSAHFALLYDIYHMQIDEGDVIRTIKDNHKYFVHYHTGGVPGRHEIDESQELYYPAIMKAILETGFNGFVAQEFIPSKDDKNQQLAALEQGVRICDV